MAIFGSLGKMLGLDSPFGRGVVTGLAEGVTREVKDDMERMKNKVDRIADYKVKKTAEEEERYKKELSENLDEVKAIVGKMGSVDGANYLIQKHGFRGAKERVEKISSMADYLGVSPDEVIRMDNEAGPTGVTADQLAAFVTRPVAKVDTSVMGKADAPGLMSIFGYDVGEEADKQAESLLRGMAIDTSKYQRPTDLAMPTAMGVEEGMLGMLQDPGDEAKRLFTQAFRLQQAAASTKDPTERAAAEKLAKERLNEAQQMQKINNISSGKSMTISQTNVITSVANNHLSAKHDLKGDYGADGLFRFKDVKSADYSAAMKATGMLVSGYEAAILANMSPAKANQLMYEAIAMNRNIIANPDKTDIANPYIVDMSDDAPALFTPASGTPPLNNGAEENNSVKAIPQTAEERAQELIAGYPTANASQKQAIIDQLRRMGLSDAGITGRLGISELPG